MDVATRRVGRRVTVTAAGTGRVWFGPFLPGERVRLVRLFLAGAAVVIGDLALVQLAAADTDGVDTAASFATMRAITVGSPAVSLLSAAWDIPAEFEATEKERFLAVQITPSRDVDGSAWVVLGGNSSYARQGEAD